LNTFVPAVNIAQQPTATSSEADMIETIQRFLQQLGYDPGPVDGIMGKKTRTAIQAFQRDHNLRVDGEASMTLVEAITQATLAQAKPRPEQEQEQEQERQPTQAELTTMSPNELYVRAVRFEAQGEIEKALRYYEYLMETYPDHELAVKAADRVAIISTPTPQPTATPTPQPTPTPPLQLTPIPTPTPTPTPKPRGMSKGTKVALGVGAVAVAGGIALLASGGDGDGGSPTGPSESVYFFVHFYNARISRTIWKATLSLDGKVIDSQPATGGPVWSVVFQRTISIQRGQHTLSVTIASQTSSYNTYTATGSFSLGGQYRRL